MQNHNCTWAHFEWQDNIWKTNISAETYSWSLVFCLLFLQLLPVHLLIFFRRKLSHAFSPGLYMFCIKYFKWCHSSLQTSIQWLQSPDRRRRCVFSLLTGPPRTRMVRGGRSMFAWQASSKSAGVAREGNGNQMTFFPLELAWSHCSNRSRVVPTKFETLVCWLYVPV